MGTNFTTHPKNQVDRTRVEIISVNLDTQKAIGGTRFGQQKIINISYPVGGLHVNPAEHEQWYIVRFDGEWRLDNKIPFNDPTQLIEDKAGGTKVGSTTGPLDLAATYTEVHGPLVLKSYPTGGRPDAEEFGMGSAIYDSTLHKPVFSDGLVWRDSAGTVV